MSLVKLTGIVIALLAGTAVTVSDYVESRRPQAQARAPLEVPDPVQRAYLQDPQLSQELPVSQEEQPLLELHAV